MVARNNINRDMGLTTVGVPHRAPVRVPQGFKARLATVQVFGLR